MDKAAINAHFALFGLKVRDRVTGFAGVVTSVSFDLYGCVQAVVTPSAGEAGKLEDSRWFDTKRLEAIDFAPVMALPTFEVVPGPEGKPAASSLPPR